MLRPKSVLATVVLLASVVVVPQTRSQVATPKAIIAGSSPMWQSAALGAYNFKAGGTNGACISGFVAPCFHYTSSSTGFQVNDTRPTKKAGTTAADVNAIWIVWDSHTTTAGAAPNFIAYIKVDSTVGDRCYYGQPRCNVTAVGGVFPGPANAISVWPDGTTDQTPPADIQSLFTNATGPLVSAAATALRPEDAMFSMCRVNSAPPATLDAKMNGLGYNNNNASGVCPTTLSLANLVGTDITDGLGSTAHVLAFNVTGTDPFSGAKVVEGTPVTVGAVPIVFLTHNLGGSSPLSEVTSVTDVQLQGLFANTGAGCDGTTLGGSAGNVDIFLREPQAAEANVAEFTTFLYPDFSGSTQEAYLDVTAAGSNPLNQVCPGGGGKRVRGIGTTHTVDKGIVLDTTNDSITYAFFSYGNVKSAADNGNFHYLTLNGVDPIFHKYVSTAGGSALDPGQPNTSPGEIPSSADTPLPRPPATDCNKKFPCREDEIWKGGLSFPNLRSGQYREWSVLRFISDGTALSSVKNLVAASQAYAAISTPDYVPGAVIPANSTTGFPGDPGLELLRSHYQQVDNAGALIGGAPVNDADTGDVGADAGGCILHLVLGTSPNQIKQTDSTTGLIHTSPGTECSFAPASH
jgi:hypothetical protein